MTHSQRRDRLRARLEADGLDALLVTDLINVRYLSGFTGSNGALLVFADDRPPVLATDGRYRTQAAEQAPTSTSPSNARWAAIWPAAPPRRAHAPWASRATWSPSTDSTP